MTQITDPPALQAGARAALAQEWEAKAPQTPEQILEFYRSASGMAEDLDVWHTEPERQAWSKMIVHVATESDARIVVDIGCGAGHDLRALAEAVPGTRLHGVEPNHALWDRFNDIAAVWNDVDEAPIKYADLLICIDVLEHVVDPEAWLATIAQRAKIDALLFEATATHDATTPLHLKANRGWHPGRVLERHGWTLVDTADRVRVWKRVQPEGPQTSGLLLCTYKVDSYFDPVMAVTGRSVAHTGWRFRALSGDADIGRARGRIVSEWWAQTNDDTFLMIDHDIGFSADDADRAVELCRNGYDIVCGAYPVHNGEHFAMKCLPGTDTIQFGPGAPPIEIQYAATGFMAVHRRVIDALIKTMPLCHSARSWAYYPLFGNPVVEDEEAGGWARLSEDYGFSHWARELGFKVWLDPQTRLTHGSSVPISPMNMGAVFAAISKA